VILPVGSLPPNSFPAPEATSISSPAKPSGSVATLWPSVFASMAISRGDSTRRSAESGKLTRPGNSSTAAATPAAARASRLYSAMRRPLAEPASRDGMSVVMRSMSARTRSTDSAARTSASDMGHSTRGGPGARHRLFRKAEQSPIRAG
jgi:hypothetical protein